MRPAQRLKIFTRNHTEVYSTGHINTYVWMHVNVTYGVGWRGVQTLSGSNLCNVTSLMKGFGPRCKLLVPQPIWSPNAATCALVCTSYGAGTKVENPADISRTLFHLFWYLDHCQVLEGVLVGGCKRWSCAWPGAIMEGLVRRLYPWWQVVHSLVRFLHLLVGGVIEGSVRRLKT